jgi:Rhodopirellula transposase DDE domain
MVGRLIRQVEPTSRGDLGSPLRWTCKSTRNLADELAAQGHRVSANAMAGLLVPRQEAFAPNTVRTWTDQICQDGPHV